jgi:hypothetical protein
VTPLVPAYLPDAVGPLVGPNGWTVEGGVVPQGFTQKLGVGQHVLTMQICPLGHSAVVAQVWRPLQETFSMQA